LEELKRKIKRGVSWSAGDLKKIILDNGGFVYWILGKFFSLIRRIKINQN